MATWGRRIVTAVSVASVVYFAVEGGEWGTAALLRQRAHSRALTDSVERLTRTVDSLARYKALVHSDPATQERIAREQFGYVRAHELVYKVVNPVVSDSTRRPVSPR